MRLLRKLLLSAGVLAGAAGLAHAASMSSGWQHIDMSQDQCLTTGANAVQSMGFQPDRQQFFVGGWRGLDGIVVRCAADRNMAIIFVYLAEGNVAQASQMVEQIRLSFVGGGSGGGGAQPGGK